MASPVIAETWARQFLAAHIDVLAPGAVASDFVLVSDQLNPSGDVRSIGFAQYANNVAVLGGSISFAFKKDRMIMAGSTALPHVALATSGTIRAARPGGRLAAVQVSSAAEGWLASAGHSVASRGVAAAQIIVPVVHRRGAAGPDISYTLAEQVAVETTTGPPGRWNVYVDAASGAALARESTLMFESGTVLYDVSNRGPMAAAGRTPQPAPSANLQVNGAPTASDASGVVSWTGANPATVVPGLGGALVTVTNAAGSLATDTLSLANGGSVVWSRASEPEVDAQIASFIYANQVKRYAKTYLDSDLAYLDQQLSVVVNDPGGACNAFSTGDDLHFYPETPGVCENTARIADLVYHEYGHSIHHHALIVGVGQFDGAMSEGVADTLAAAMTGDPGVGRGFYFDDEPLRNLAPAVALMWPSDLIGEVHHDGEIYGETMWNLRTNLQNSLGVQAGFAQFLKIYYGTVQRAVDIPSSFAEALVADDDDGDLSNGTPNDCAIISAFLAHGLFDPVVTGDAVRPVRDHFTVSVAPAVSASTRCAVPTVASGELAWRVKGGALASVPLTAGSGGALIATIPTQPDGSVVEYSVALTMSNGTTQPFPDNNADPMYQFYVGNVTKIWCAGFENGAADWTHTATPASADRWQSGPPRGLGGDPAMAYDGTSVLGIALDGDGTYAASMTTAASSPVVDLHGATNVHLQFYRWLGVEDGQYDQATVAANGTVVWRNRTVAVPAVTLSPIARTANSSLNLIDREWRFQDIDVSAQVAAGRLQLAFALTSDAAFQAGGWTLDDVCLVSPGGTCPGGDAEHCDDEAAAAGCCNSGGSPAAPMALAAAVLAWLARRRRSQRLTQRLRSLR